MNTPGVINRAQWRGMTRTARIGRIPVGQKQPNELGLYDMSGNVTEWVQDCWHGNYSGAPSDGRAWESGNCSLRVLRGGSWYLDPRSLRSAGRGRLCTGSRYSNFGFRVARTLAP